MIEQNDLLILVIENEVAVRKIISDNLIFHNFQTKEVVSGDEALKYLNDLNMPKPDLIILDEGLAGLSGIEVCTILRTKSHTKNIPIIMLTSKGKDFDQVKGIENGLDDYIVKPFSPSELVTCVKTVIRKTKPIFNSNKVLEYRDLKLDMAAFKVVRGVREIHLGPTEFKILQCLLEYPKSVLSRKHIMSQVWGYNSQIEQRTIDVHINRLRNALKNTPDELSFIRTIRSAGYCLGGPGTE